MAQRSDDTSYFRRTSSGSFSMRTNMVGTSWVCVILYLPTSLRNSSASKCSMITDGAAQPHDAHVEAQRRGVIERRRRQIDRVLVHAVELARDGEQRIVEVDRLRLDHRQHTLGPPGGARRIEHVVARGLVGDRRCGKARDRRFPGFVAGDRAVDHEARVDTLEQRRELGGRGGEVLRGDEQPGAAVGHDVVDFGRRQPRADRGVDRGPSAGRPSRSRRTGDCSPGRARCGRRPGAPASGKAARCGWIARRAAGRSRSPRCRP